jgi:peptidyl-prolyl cis-trans isomerase SurA
MRINRLPLTLLAISLIVSCKTKPPVQQVTQQQPVLVEIGNEKFSPDDFQDSFTKNRFASDSSKGLSPQEYLTLYTDLKLKVLQAKGEGRDTTSDYKEEIASYRDQLAKNFLVDKPMVEKLANEAYNRLKQEVRVSHILIPVSEDASAEDTLQAYRAAVAMRGRLEEGSDFGDLAAKFSKDPTAVHNKGDLGYFTAFQTLYPFENAIYTLSVGKNSQPLRTKSGYHIIKVTDRRSNRGNVRIAHIMTRLDANSSETQKAAAKSRIDEAYQKLQNGDAWDNVAETYSDDKESSRNHGLLPAFGTGQMVSEVEETAFALTKTNSYSKPVLSPYGWHIIKLIEKKGLEPYTVMAPSLRQKVVTDTRGKILEQATVKRLREKLSVKEFPDQWALLAPLADSTLISGKWDYMKPVSVDWSANTLFTIEKEQYQALAFLNFVKQKQQPRPKDSSPAVIFKRYYNEFLTDRLIRYEKDHLEETAPEFRGLITEIREGVLLSQLMEENVWQKSLSDSVGQLNFYKQNAGRYQYPERALATIVSAPDTQTVNRIKKTISKKPYLLEKIAPEIRFREGASELTNAQTDNLKELFTIMEKNPDYIVEVAGYRLPQEAESISGSRIRNVVKYLNSKNISIVRIIEKDYGSFRQAVEPERNRRVAFQFFSQSTKDVEKAYNSQAQNTVSIEEGYFSKSNPLLNKAKWETGDQLISGNANVTWIQISKIEPPRPKTFTEARGTVINEYQKELEKQLLSRLHQKFPVKVNEQELDKIKR